MNVKEILERLKDNIPIEEYKSEGTSDGLTHYEEDKDSWQYKLYNYITNLQKENDILKSDIESLKNNYNELAKMYENRLDSYLDLKSRNEKAKEYIKEHIRIDDEYPAYMEMLVEEKNELLNIL